MQTTIILIAIANLLCPDPVTKWTILSGSMVPVFMNASISPEFSQIIFNAGDSITNGITPLLTYFVIYVAFLEKYNTSSENISLGGSMKYMVHYGMYFAIIMILAVIGWYMIGIPTGVGSFPGVMYGA